MPALVSAASISARGVGSSVQQRRHQLLSEWNAWAANQSHGARPTLQSCGPHEVLIFLEHYRSQHHGRAPTPAGVDPESAPLGPTPLAPSTMRQVAGNLSALLAATGRSGEWGLSNTAGNPVRSTA
eukprot:scaffold64144_cov45-Prasinocladus_malaysianus.AAC.1